MSSLASGQVTVSRSASNLVTLNRPTAAGGFLSFPGWPAVAIGRDAGRSAPARSVVVCDDLAGLGATAPGDSPSSGELTATTEAMLGRAVCRSQRVDDWRSAGEPAVVGIR